MARQWLSLVGTILLQSINGTNSNFPAYSSQLKRLLSLSQLQLNNLAFASDAGKLFGFFSGLAANYLPLWLVLMIGSLLGLVGYGVQYLFLVNQISSLSYLQVFFLTVLAGNSICWINTVCYIVAIQNFPFDRRVAVGLSTGYIGLSAKIYTEIVGAVSPSSSPVKEAKTYLLLNSILPLIVCILTAPVVRCISSGKSRKIEVGFVIMFVITIATGIYAMTTSFSSVSAALPPLPVVIVMCGFLLAPLAVPFAEKMMERQQKKCLIRREKRVYDVSIVEVGGGGDSLNEGRKGGGIEELGRAAAVVEVEVEVAEEEEEIGAKEMVMRLDFWLYFFVYLFGATLGLVYLNNLGQIAESRGYSRTSSLVSLSSSFGFFGRLLPSLFSYVFSRSKCMGSTPACIAALMAPMSGAFFLLLSRTSLSLNVSTAVIGLCTGAITSVAVSTTTELFGAKNFSVNHNVVVANIPIGSFLFGDLAALLYRQRINASDGRCFGDGCYRQSFIIWGSLCSLGSFLALILHARTKNRCPRT